MAIAATREALDAHPTVEEALFWLFDESIRQIFAEALHRENAWGAIQASPTARGRVSRDDLDSLSAMGSRVPVPYERRLTAAETTRLRKCIIPEGSDDRWFAFVAEGMLHMHRTWTGFHIIEARLVERPDGGADLVDVYANGDEQERGVPLEDTAGYLDLDFVESETSEERFMRHEHELFVEGKYLPAGCSKRWRADHARKVVDVLADAERLARHIERKHCRAAAVFVVDDDNLFEELRDQHSWPERVEVLVASPLELGRRGAIVG